MQKVTVQAAKTNLSKLIDAVIVGRQSVKPLPLISIDAIFDGKVSRVW